MIILTQFRKKEKLLEQFTKNHMVGKKVFFDFGFIFIAFLKAKSYLDTLKALNQRVSLKL